MSETVLDTDTAARWQGYVLATYQEKEKITKHGYTAETYWDEIRYGPLDGQLQEASLQPNAR